MDLPGCYNFITTLFLAHTQRKFASIDITYSRYIYLQRTLWRVVKYKTELRIKPIEFRSMHASKTSSHIQRNIGYVIIIGGLLRTL